MREMDKKSIFRIFALKCRGDFNRPNQNVGTNFVRPNLINIIVGDGLDHPENKNKGGK